MLLQTETGTTRQVKPVAEFLEVFAVESGGVTATGPATSGVTASGPAPGSHRTVSLVVTPDQARVIKLAEFVGQLHIVLRARDAEPTMIPSDLTALEKLLSGPGEMPTRSQPEPVFSGKTFDEWELVVLTERNPDDLKTAVEAFGRLIDQNIAQARYLAELIAVEPALELTAPVEINIVCFRYRADGLARPALKALNIEIMLRLQEQGTAALSDTTVYDEHCLRVAIANHRTRREDLALLVQECVRIGREVSEEPCPVS